MGKSENDRNYKRQEDTGKSIGFKEKEKLCRKRQACSVRIPSHTSDIHKYTQL